MAKKISFPNGFDAWQETHFVVVENILHAASLQNGNFAENEINERGQGGLWIMARALTDWFELKFKGENWGIKREYFDELEKMFDSLYEGKTFSDWCAKNGVEY